VVAVSFRAGYSLKELWSENRWVLDSHGNEVPTAFVLQDSGDREVDVHAMRLDDRGQGVPAWVEDELVLKDEDLAGEGAVGGLAVRCIAPATQMLFHTGYNLPLEQIQDLERLQDRLSP
jgi:hypothetical protein